MIDNIFFFFTAYYYALCISISSRSSNSDRSYNSCDLHSSSSIKDKHINNNLRGRDEKRRPVYILEGRLNSNFRVWIQEEVLLGYPSSFCVDGNCRKAHLQHPGVHDVVDSVRKFSATFVNSLWKQMQGH